MASTRTTTWVLEASPGSRRHDVRLAQGIHHASCSTTTDGPLFGQPHLSSTGGHPPRSPTPPEGATTKRRKRDAQAGVPLAGWPRAQLAFKDSMVHGILQFTPGIAFRYVLHRCESRDIRCRESSNGVTVGIVASCMQRGPPTSMFVFLGAIRAGVGSSSPRSSRPRANRHSGCCRDEPDEQSLTHSRSSSSVGLDNDPSAGSPTETLLRLLLPLNDKVQWTSRDVAGGEPPPSPRSEHFTGPFNR